MNNNTNTSTEKKMEQISMTAWMNGMEGDDTWRQIKRQVAQSARREYGVGAVIDVWELYGSFDWYACDIAGAVIREDDFQEMSAGIEKLLVD